MASSQSTRAIRVCLFGASTDTGNLGVSALCLSVLGGLARLRPHPAVTVFDEGWGERRERLDTPDGWFEYSRCGARYSKRFHRPESMWNIRLSCMLGGLANPGARALLDADAVLDISGGDSFTDLYGPKRFNSVIYTKLLALKHRIPLVLLPQTYGPFEDPRRKQVAGRIVRNSALAWARDEHSFRALKELTGDGFDPDRHRSGVDVAFALESRRPPLGVGAELESWLREGGKLVGLNVSGLIHNDPASAAARFGLKAEYGKIVRELLKRLLKDREVRVVLVPHVVTPMDHYESDIRACVDARGALGPGERDRVIVCPTLNDPRHAKWVISQLSWFCGTRMHATIAALSSGVPAAAIAYSLKTAGVFESCGQQDHVADPRTLDTDQAVDRLWRSWTTREEAKATLARHLPAVLAQAGRQIELTVDDVRETASIPD
jgi:polysaccharide pyruvyl transferase WcaK-like protein